MKPIMSFLFNEARESRNINITELSKSRPICKCWVWSTEGNVLHRLTSFAWRRHAWHAGQTSLRHHSLKDIFHSTFMSLLFLHFCHVSEQYMVERWCRRGPTSEFSESRVVPIASLQNVFLLTTAIPVKRKTTVYNSRF